MHFLQDFAFVKNFKTSLPSVYIFKHGNMISLHLVYLYVALYITFDFHWTQY